MYNLKWSWKIEVREDPNPQLARIIIDGEWIGNYIFSSLFYAVDVSVI